MKKNWWKILGAILVLYSTIAGLLMGVPRLPILHESIRNLYFHVPMWFAMIVLFSNSIYFGVKSLISQNQEDDLKAVESVNVGVVFGILGLLTGMVWAKFAWGEFWSFDPKQNFSAISLLLYFAYLILRNAIDEEQKRAKISAIYNIFAFPMMIVLIFVLPRLKDSLHPGNGGNPGFNMYDLDSRMRMVFYPACLGWILIGYWIYTIRFRISMKKIAFTLIMLITTLNLFAQGSEIEMADALRSNGKIYIVVISIVIILLGLLIYLFAIEKRLKMLEKKSSDKN